MTIQPNQYKDANTSIGNNYELYKLYKMYKTDIRANGSS